MDEYRVTSVPLFSSLSKAEAKRVAGITDEVDVREGAELLRQGNFAHEFMVIEEGQARVERDGEPVAELGPGDFLGEIAALDRGQRNASVIAATPMTLIVMTARDLRAIAREMPGVENCLRTVAATRLPTA